MQKKGRSAGKALRPKPMMDFLLCTGFAVPPAALLPYGDEVLIDPRLLHKRLMGAPLSDLSIRYDEDLIRASDGVQPVGDDQQGLPFTSSEMACWM